METNNVACNYCEQDRRGGWIYCRSCGTALSDQPAPALVPDSERSETALCERPD